MKVAVAGLLIIVLLNGCTSKDKLIDRSMNLRKQILEAESCSFQVGITADYYNQSYTFQMDCVSDSSGNLIFAVTGPDSINGITGTLSHEGGALTFDDKILAFPLLTQLQLSPVSGPWIFLNTLKSGYITGCSSEKDGYTIYIDDSFADNPLHLQVNTNSKMIPYRAEIIWQDRRIISLDIHNFTIV